MLQNFINLQKYWKQKIAEGDWKPKASKTANLWLQSHGVCVVVFFCYFTHKLAAFGTIRLLENGLKDTSLILFLIVLGTINLPKVQNGSISLPEVQKQPFF